MITPPNGEAGAGQQQAASNGALSERAAAMHLAGKGSIRGALGILRRLVESNDDPEDRMTLGMLAYLGTEIGEAHGQLERAYRDFQTRGQPRRAALAATALGRVHFDLLDDGVVGRAWLARALHLLEDQDCVEKGYVLVGQFGAAVESAEELESCARRALDLAHQFHDPNLECKALGDSGLALVSMGRVRDGMARLDEALTLIFGGDCRDPGVISQVFCDLMSACDRCGDAERARAWMRMIDTSTPRTAEGPAVHLYAHCWTALGGVLCHAGRWQEAEIALRMALARGESSYHSVKLAARAALAELWVRQGRLDEAARLIDQNADRVEVLIPRAHLHLAQGRCDLAAAVARQALRQVRGDELRGAGLLLLLVEAELHPECGNIVAAEDAAGRLRRMAEHTEVAAVAAQAALALGQVTMARGNLEGAVQHFEAGLAALGDACPPLRAALHLGLARACARLAPAESAVNAESALHIYQRLGCPEAALAADLLSAQGRPVPRPPAPPTPLAVLSRRERDVLACLAGGLSNPDIARRLSITHKTAEHHVSNILAKLGLHNRTEAAAFAASFQISQEDQRAAGRSRASAAKRWGCW